MELVVSLATAIGILQNVGNEMFYIEFIKRTTGELRKMTCRRHVKKGVTGAGRKGWDKSSSDGLLTVYDMNKKTADKRGAFRMINLDSIVRFKVKGQEYRVDPSA